MINYELAQEDYLQGMKYKDIAVKYDVSINTVKSWKKRYGWSREIISDSEKVAEKEKENAHKKPRQKHSKIRKAIEADLYKQLEDKGASREVFINLIADYMSLWDIKNDLIADISERGVVVEWSNGKQKGKKKNDSVNELNKTNGQMLKLLSELGLKVSEVNKGDPDADDV